MVLEYCSFGTVKAVRQLQYTDMSYVSPHFRLYEVVLLRMCARPCVAYTVKY